MLLSLLECSSIILRREKKGSTTKFCSMVFWDWWYTRNTREKTSHSSSIESGKYQPGQFKISPIPHHASTLNVKNNVKELTFLCNSWSCAKMFCLRTPKWGNDMRKFQWVQPSFSQNIPAIFWRVDGLTLLEPMTCKKDYRGGRNFQKTPIEKPATSLNINVTWNDFPRVLYR